MSVIISGHHKAYGVKHSQKSALIRRLRIYLKESNLPKMRAPETGAVTVICESRNLQARSYIPSEDQLATGRSCEEWWESIEKEFRIQHFRIYKRCPDYLWWPRNHQIGKSLLNMEGADLTAYTKLPQKNKQYANTCC